MVGGGQTNAYVWCMTARQVGVGWRPMVAVSHWIVSQPNSFAKCSEVCGGEQGLFGKPSRSQCCSAAWTSANILCRCHELINTDRNGRSWLRVTEWPFKKCPFFCAAGPFSVHRRYTTFWPLPAEPSRKIMHVPISHATLQCSATPSASMHPRPNPSSLSMVASRQCLGALSKGIGWGGGSQKRSKTERQWVTHRKTRSQRGCKGDGCSQLDGVVHGRLQAATPILVFCNISLLLCGTTWTTCTSTCKKMELKHSFVFNFLQDCQCSPPPLVPVVCCFPMNSTLPLSDVPLFAVHCSSSLFAFLVFPFLCSFSFLTHFVLSNPRLHIFVSLVVFSFTFCFLFYLPPFSSSLLSH